MKMILTTWQSRPVVVYAPRLQHCLEPAFVNVFFEWGPVQCSFHPKIHPKLRHWRKLSRQPASTRQPSFWKQWPQPVTPSMRHTRPAWMRTAGKDVVAQIRSQSIHINIKYWFFQSLVLFCYLMRLFNCFHLSPFAFFSPGCGWAGFFTMFGCSRRWGGWIWLCISLGLSTNLQAMLSTSQGGHAKLALHPWNSCPPAGLGSLRGWDRAARYIRKASWRSGARPCGTHLVYLFHLSILAWKPNHLGLAVAHCRSPERASGHAISDQSCQFQWSLAAISA